jgi:hypothetical protein
MAGINLFGDVLHAKSDIALINRSGDPERKLPAAMHDVELGPAVPAAEGVASLDPSVPTDEDLATLPRVPARFSWKGINR